MHVQYDMIQCSSFREEVFIYLKSTTSRTVPDHSCTTPDIKRNYIKSSIILEGVWSLPIFTNNKQTT